MKTIKDIRMAIVFISLSLWVSGCAHSTEGTVFGQSELSQIVRGKTTSSELMNIFGTPYSKEAEPEGGEQWFYFCSHNSDQLVVVPAVVVETKKKQKTNLSILLNKDKVVVDFTLNEGPISKESKAFISVPVPGVPVAVTVPITLTSTNSK
jgi:outer membrane protein assembly factor BamE (lipoprotein component of BamABCDE complex)